MVRALQSTGLHRGKKGKGRTPGPLVTKNVSSTALNLGRLVGGGNRAPILAEVWQEFSISGVP